MSDPDTDDTERYALVDSHGRIPFHNGYEDVRTAHKEAERIGKDHPRESPETVNVIKTSGSESVTFRSLHTEIEQTDASHPTED